MFPSTFACFKSSRLEKKDLKKKKHLYLGFNKKVEFVDLFTSWLSVGFAVVYKCLMTAEKIYV